MADSPGMSRLRHLMVSLHNGKRMLDGDTVSEAMKEIEWLQARNAELLEACRRGHGALHMRLEGINVKDMEAIERSLAVAIAKTTGRK